MKISINTPLNNSTTLNTPPRSPISYLLHAIPLLWSDARSAGWLTITLTILLSLNATAQNIGINTATPDASSIMDITANNRGLLIPRVALTAVNLAAPVTSPALSLLVFNTNTIVGANGVKPGYYYWDATKWVGIGTGSAWDLLGNAGTSAGTNFIGTVDAQDIVFKTNGLENARILNTNGNVGIGTTTPVRTLDVNGSGVNIFSTGINTVIDMQVTSSHLYRTQADGNGYSIYDITAFPFVPRIAFSNNGNVAINSGVPANNTLEITHGTAGNSGLRFSNLPNVGVLSTNASGDVVPNTTPNPANALFWGLTGNSGTSAGTNFIGTTDAQSLVFKTNGVENMRILNTNGNVGIGTIAPTAQLNLVSELLTNRGISISQYSNAANVGASLRFQFGRGTALSPLNVQGGDILGSLIFMGYNGTSFAPNSTPSGIQSIATENFTAAANGSNLIFNTVNNSTTLGTEKMRISENGNVGIGTNAPGAKLDVAGVVLFANNKGSLSYFNPVGYDQTEVAAIGVSTSLSLVTNGVSKLNITPMGNVGIGTTTPTSKLAIVGDIQIIDGTEGLGKVLTSDATGKGSWVAPAYKYPNTFANGNTATVFSVPSPSGGFVITSAPLVITKAGVYKIKGNAPISMTTGPGNFFYGALEDAGNTRAYEIIDDRAINTVINTIEYLPIGTYHFKIWTFGSSTITVNGINLLAEALFLE
jgi:hypothetical protein